MRESEQMRLVYILTYLSATVQVADYTGQGRVSLELSTGDVNALREALEVYLDGGCGGEPPRRH